MDLPRDRLSIEEEPLMMDSEPYLDLDRLYPSSLDKRIELSSFSVLDIYLLGVLFLSAARAAMR